MPKTDKDGLVRYSGEPADWLRTIAKRCGVTVEQALSNVIYEAKVLSDVRQEGGKILIEDKKGNLFNLTVVPRS